MSNLTGPESCAEGIYVYAIIDGRDLPALPSDGLIGGIPGCPHVHRDLAAWIRRVPLADFGPAGLKARLADMRWLEAQVRSHQAVLDAVAVLATTIPMKFPTVYVDPAGLDGFLERFYDQLTAMLGDLRGRSEWGLKVYCDEAILAGYVATTDPEVQQLVRQVQGRAAGAAYLFGRKLQQAQDRAAERVRVGVAQAILGATEDLSAAVKTNPLHGREITGRTDRMVLNCACLIEGTNVDRFHSGMQELAMAHRDSGFQLELSGPWPPYNFVSLQEDEACPQR